MRHALWVPLALALLAAPARAEALDPSDAVRIQAQASQHEVYVGELFEVRLVLDVNASFFEAHAVPLFRREMDYPVQVTAPWLDALPGAERRNAPAPDETDLRASLVLNGKLAEGQELLVLGGRREGSWNQVTFRSRYRAEREGTLRLKAPVLRFAHAERFEEDFLGGRVPYGRSDEEVQGRAVEITVRPLPDDGRPATFRGAIGRRVLVSASAAPKPDADGVWTYTFRVLGDVDIESLRPPPNAALAGFHVYGRRDRREALAERATFEYELAPLEDTIDAVPGVRFAYFDPGPPGVYRVAETDSIPLGRAPAPPPVAPARTPETPVSPWYVVAALGGLGVGVLLGRWRRRVLERRRAAAEPGPAAILRERLGTEQVDPAEAFAAFLAAHLQVEEAAVIGPRLAARLEHAGLDTDLATRTAATMEQLVATRYGTAPATPVTGAALAELADEVEARLQRRTM